MSCDAKQLKVGSRLSRVSYLEVLEVSPKGVVVKNTNGLQWTINPSILEAETISADQFSETKKVNRTEMAELLENAKDCIFTVTFGKQLSAEKVLNNLKDSERMSKQQLAKAILQEEQRVLIGRLVSTENKLGRSIVEDLENTTGTSLRLVDHRTISELILNNIKYVLK
jgi:arsenate reductase-like glutaredoxin family protein